MYSRSEYHRFSHGYLFWYAREVCHDQHVYVVTRQRLAEDRFTNLVFVLECASFWNEFAEIGVGVWVAVGKVNCIHVILSCVLESEAIVDGSIAIVGWLLRSTRCIVDLIRIKILISSKLWTILIFESFFQSSRLIVCDVLAISLPAYVDGVCILHGVSQRSHALVVGWIRLHEID